MGRKRKKRKLTRRTALGMIAGGAVLTASGTVAFTDISGSRKAGVDVADDATAFFSIENALDPNQTPLFTNLTNANMEVTLSSNDNIEFDPDGNGNFDEPVTFPIASGDSEDVKLSGSDDKAIVDIFVNLTKDGENAGSIELSREFDIPNAGVLDDIEPTVTNIGKSGKYRFELENTSNSPVSIDGVAVKFDTVEECRPAEEAVQVGGPNQDDIFVLVDNNEQIVTNVIDDSTINPFTRDISFSASGGGNDTNEFEFQRFRNAAGDGVAVEDLDIVIRATDGSTQTIQLRAAESDASC